MESRVATPDQAVRLQIIHSSKNFFAGTVTMREEQKVKTGGQLTERQWVRRTLTENEGTIETVEDPDHGFTKKDFLRMIFSMWPGDHRRFMPGLLKAIIMLALQLYLFTGARTGAFIPIHEDRNEKG
ncbi:hypothetical protein N7532_010373 [Penicillium argentinense]|uniref:Uncharacterized protein n=1 Tax=Penicillium argentinense TaxID=1131581 RepID=A0A9W9EPG8_9EURO|nr:uncharacterized protein N7532_010373 [Penicillium argentinense]KAJ5085602.1 hypothetical protein N7532_010373 [Penicillium argentinense]